MTPHNSILEAVGEQAIVEGGIAPSWSDFQLKSLLEGYSRYGANWEAIMKDPILSEKIGQKSAFSLADKWDKLPKNVKDVYENQYLKRRRFSSPQDHIQSAVSQEGFQSSRRNSVESIGDDDLEKRDEGSVVDRVWTDAEVSALQIGVTRYGNDWKAILLDSELSDVLKHRSMFSLKSKWGRISKRWKTMAENHPGRQMPPLKKFPPRAASFTAVKAKIDTAILGTPGERMGAEDSRPSLASISDEFPGFTSSDSVVSIDMSSSSNPANFSLPAPAQSIKVSRQRALQAILYNKRGLARHEVGLSLQSAEDFTECVLIDPDHTNGYINRGLIHCLFSEFDSAMLDTSLAVALEPRSPDAYLARALAYGFSGLHTKCLEDCRRALEIRINFGEARCVRGITLMTLAQDAKMVKSAVTELRAAIEFEPTRVFARRIWKHFQQVIQKYFPNPECESMSPPKVQGENSRAFVGNSKWLATLSSASNKELESPAMGERVTVTEISRRGLFHDVIEKLADLEPIRKAVLASTSEASNLTLTNRKSDSNGVTRGSDPDLIDFSACSSFLTSIFSQDFCVDTEPPQLSKKPSIPPLASFPSSHRHYEAGWSLENDFTVSIGKSISGESAAIFESPSSRMLSTTPPGIDKENAFKRQRLLAPPSES